MWLRWAFAGDAPRWRGMAPALAILVALVLGAAAQAHDAAAATPANPAMDSAMSSAGWLQDALIKLEHEAMSDVGMLPDTPAAIAREWRTFDRDGSALGALVALGWVVLGAAIALAAERLVARGLSRRVRRAMRARAEGPSVGGLMLLLLCDIAGLYAFFEVFVSSRHWLMGVGVSVALMILAIQVLIRWRIFVMIFNLVLRPEEPAARLIALPDAEARRLSRFLSAAFLAIVTLVGFGRYGLMDEDSGAPHVVALIIVIASCALCTLIVFRARAFTEALIRGGSGIVGAMRNTIAEAWPAIGMAYVAGIFVFYVTSLSLGILAYFHAANSTLGILLLLLVFDKLAERGWRDRPPGASGVERAVDHGLHRMLKATVLLGAALTVAWLWTTGLETAPAGAASAMRSAAAALVTLYLAYVVWELTRLAIDGHLQNVATGPRLPGEEDDEAAPGSRLQTILPMLRAAFGVLIAVVVVLIVLSRLGIDTAPLIAGAGVFGLAISFGAQSLVRDIISGLFYLWDDAFRVGEYIDTGRLKGTVEALGIRSVKLRHHNGPLHTIPYGQLGAVTNLSRDFATIKFNLRLERSSDIELVRRTAKRIGLDMQENPEIAAEVMLPLKMQGIAEVTDTALVLRFKFTARPVKPSWVQREYLKAMYRVFAEKGIEFAVGALTLQSAPSSRTGLGAADAEPAAPALVEALPAPSRVA